MVSGAPPVGVATTLPSGCAARSAGAKVADHVPPAGVPGAVAAPSVAVSAVAPAAAGAGAGRGRGGGGGWWGLVRAATRARGGRGSSVRAGVVGRGGQPARPGPPPPLLTAVV